MKLKKTISFLLGIFALSFSAIGQAGDIDSSFNTDGAAFFHFIGGKANAAAVVILPNEKILVAGSATIGPGTDSDIFLLRYLPDGTLDAGFGSGGYTRFSYGGQDDYAKAMAIQPDGRVLVAGYTVSGEIRLGILCRFLENGELDSSFGGDGVLVYEDELTSTPSVGVFQSKDEKIIWCLVTQKHDASINRYLLDGMVDNSYGNQGRAFLALPGGTATHGTFLQLPDGRVAAYSVFKHELFDDFSGIQQTVYLVFPSVFSEDGKERELMWSLGINGAYLSGAINWKEEIVITCGSIAKLNDAGIIDADFGLNGIQTAIPGVALALAVQIDGKLMVAGHGEDTSNVQGMLVRLETDGELDKRFGNNGHTYFDFNPGKDIANAVALDADDRIVVAGQSGDSLLVARFWGGKHQYLTNPGVEAYFATFRPNPVHELFTADYGLPEDATITIEMMDIYGRIVQPFYIKTPRQAGHYVEPLHMNEGLSNGTYFLRFLSGAFVFTQKIVLVR